MPVINAVVGAILLVLASGVGLAEAQIATPISSQAPKPGAIPDIREDRIRLGVLYLKPTIELKDFGFDTNVYNEAANRKSDFTFTVGPRLAVAVPFANKALIDFSSGTDLVYFREQTEERSVNVDLGLRVEAYFRPLVIYGRVALANTRQRPNLEIDARSRRLESGGRIGAVVRVLPKVFLEVSGEMTSTDYDADAVFEGTKLRDTLNRTTSGGALKMAWSLTPLTDFGVRIDRVRDVFPLAPMRDADSTRLMAGFELERRALISGSLFIGHRRLQPLDNKLPAFAGFAADARLAYRRSESWAADLGFERDVTYSFEPFEPYYISTGLAGSVRRHLFGRFDVVGEGGTRRMRYASFSTIPALSARVDKVRSYGANVGYAVGRRGRFGVGFTRWQRNSPKESRTYSANRIRTTFTYGF